MVDVDGRMSTNNTEAAEILCTCFKGVFVCEDGNELAAHDETEYTEYRKKYWMISPLSSVGAR